MTKSLFLLTSCLFLAACVSAQLGLVADPAPAVRHLSWGDQGDGTYKNPLLKADYSDPDVTRVGDDFYLVASDFHFSTMQVLHSRDLVNWSYVGKVFDRLTMDPKYDQMRGYAEGTWAPSIRYHNGEFYVFVCTPSEGLFMWHAKNPAGPWSDTVTVKAVANWEDPCPFWDDDGSAYLVHSRKGAGPIIIHKMAPDGTRLLDDGTEVYRGTVSEGPKMCKRNGYYYISLPEGGVSAGGQSMLRSKNVFGPYEHKAVLTGEHQGGLVDLDNSESWFICFKQMRGTQAPLGRICFLEPVKWGEDDWPVFGDNGQPVAAFRKPNIGKGSVMKRPATSDEFAAPTLGLQWQWNHNPLNDKWSLTERPGFLRLYSSPPAAAQGPITGGGGQPLARARNTLTQKLWDDAGVVEVKMDVSHMAEGQRAGLAFMVGSSFGWVGAQQSGGQRTLDWSSTAPAGRGVGAPPQTSPGTQAAYPVLTRDALYLRGTYQGDQASLAYSFDGKTFTDTPAKFKMGFSSWKGSRPALYSFGSTSGYVDVDYFRYAYGATVAELPGAAARLP
jgi:beta-xylosidase